MVLTTTINSQRWSNSVQDQYGFRMTLTPSQYLALPACERSAHTHTRTHSYLFHIMLPETHIHTQAGRQQAGRQT